MKDLLDTEKIFNSILDYSPRIIGSIFALVFGFWAIGKLVNIVRNLMKKNGVDETIQPFLGSLMSVGLKLFLLVFVAGMFGIETTSFVAIFGALAFALGMALQGSLGHFASGILLLIFKPYRVGDLVVVGGDQTGTVVEVQIFNTILSTLDNKRIYVPNSVVTSNVITNISGQGKVGVELVFGIGYNDDIDRARSIILRVGENCPWILKSPSQKVVVAELGDSSVNLSTRPFVLSENYWDTYFYMQENVKKAFDAANIGIPYPTMDLNLVSTGATVSVN